MNGHLPCWRSKAVLVQSLTHSLPEACRLGVSEANPNEQKVTGQPMLGFAYGSPPTYSQTITRFYM